MTTRLRTTGLRLGLLLLFAGFSTGQDCRPGSGPLPAYTADVDRAQYVAGQAGSSSLTNNTNSTAWLAGCAAFSFEQSVDGQWQDRDQPIVCVWEGFAQPVAGGASASFPFFAPGASGLWRIRYPVGEGCAANMPQRACDDVFPIFTDAFTVEREPCAPETPECRFLPAAPNFLCSDGVNCGGPSSVCTRDPATGVCGYEVRTCP